MSKALAVLLELKESAEYWSEYDAPIGIHVRIDDAIEELLAQPEQTEQTEQEQNFYWNDAPVICEINGYRWYLGQEADKKLIWQDAKNWCESVGGEIPPRDILLQAYLNHSIRYLFRDGWFWCSTESDAGFAWLHSFVNGNQFSSSKAYSRYVRVVKKVMI